MVFFPADIKAVLQCQFCGHVDIPSMVEVHMAKPATYSESPVQVKGVLHLNSTDNSNSEFIVTNAIINDLK